ncbi:hypothetical protein BBD42_30425 [Paenibacillus sp. BIHB 4019]|uniref:HTH tetR-type domain-containing protein n=1 Tax=Paenibacillus sp. BIHB 4019 TaxID=1870819 RepID=A0A1B2DRI0_9BACL|nr:TetR/AcrR family transcriptional regulator [Paenibacillus sp. BIHB 4019]ANY70333.1 hypothetical protein BBD42_30425 [Paenibacillus sp. BIHB 4019]
MTKEKIFEIAIALIKSEGIKGITTRKIADLAGTNVASVNYHFGSKDKLINEVLKRHLASFHVTFNLLDDTEVPPLERLKKFLLAYSSLLLAHPELAKSLLSQEQLFESHNQFMEFMKSQGIEKLIRTVSEIVGLTDQERIMPIIIQMFAAIFFPTVIKSNANPTLTAAMIKTEQSIEQQVDLFLEFYFYKFRGKES